MTAWAEMMVCPVLLILVGYCRGDRACAAGCVEYLGGRLGAMPQQVLHGFGCEAHGSANAAVFNVLRDLKLELSGAG